MKQKYDLIVVIPIGPNTKVEFINDTIDSVYFYCQCSLKLIIVDDSRQELGLLTKEKYPDVDLLVNKKTNGLKGGLYITLSLTYKYAIDNYHFKTLFKVDTDALIIGENPQDDAERLFEENPQIGIAGLYKGGLEIIDFNNNVFDNRWPRSYMFDLVSTLRVFKRPVANFTLRKYIRMAFAKGYEIGGNIFGGAYFLSEALLVRLDRAKLLPDFKLRNTRMEEDHLFGMMAIIVDLEMGDLGRDELPFGVTWKKLPASPETLLLRKKKVIHSTRRWEDMDEYQIRQYFKDIRKLHKHSDRRESAVVIGQN
ncbi:MAG: hypothetical protein JWP44_2211 [Mucilaginibacter sp.]|nr:hypothetical protein [Mucilaginibacter sp.]